MAELTGGDPEPAGGASSGGEAGAGAGARTAHAPRPSSPYRTVLARLGEAPGGLVVTGHDDEARAALVEGLRRAGRRVLVVATSAADAAAWRAQLDQPEADTHRVAPGFAGTEDEVADQLAATAETDAWLTVLLGPPGADDTADAGGTTPPLDADELADLRRLLVAEHGPEPRLDPARRGQVLPPPAELPPEPHVEQLADELLDVVGPASSPAREVVRPLVAALACLRPDAAAGLEPVLRRIDEGMTALGRTGEETTWARGVVEAVLEGRAAAAWSRVARAVRDVERVGAHDLGSGTAQVRVTGDVDPGAAAEVFERFAAFLDDGGVLRRMFKSEEQRDAEALLPFLAINRVDPITAEGAVAVAHHLRLRQIEAAMASALGGLGRTLRPAEQRTLLVHRLLSLREVCLRIGAVLEAVGRLRVLLGGLPAAVRPPTDGLVAIGRIVATGRRLVARPSADLARRELGDVAARLTDVAPPAAQAPELRAALAALFRLDVERYAWAAETVDGAREEQRDLRRSDALAARLSAWPALLEALDADTTDETWEPREQRWTAAWAHRTAVGWLAARAPGDVTTTTVLAGREHAATTEVDLVVVGPLRDGERPPPALGEHPARVVDLPGGPDDGRFLVVLPTG